MPETQQKAVWKQRLLDLLDEMNGADLASYADGDAVLVLADNWSDCMRDENLPAVTDYLLSDVDDVIAMLVQYKAEVQKRYGDV